MMIRSIAGAIALATLSLSTLAATTQEEAQAALAAAQTAESEALAAKAAWMPTEATLTEARKAFGDGHWDQAKAAADKALSLARLSLQQANQQKTAWRDAVFR